MLEILKTIDNMVSVIPRYEPGCWINVVEPTAAELAFIKENFDIESEFIRASLDPEEAAHIDTEDEQVLIVVDIPLREEFSKVADYAQYSTIPLAIMLLKSCIITICSEEETFLQDFKENRVKGFYTQFKTRFVLQILYRNSTKYLQYLRMIEKSSNRIEQSMKNSMKNKELLQMMGLEKSLVYLSTSLRANGVLLERLLRNPHITNYPEDEDLLEDVIIENRQAIEMANLYSSILTSTTTAFASIISNNQNNVMKILTTVTIVMVIPQVIGSFMGMNVRLPLNTNHPSAFWLIVIISAILCSILIWILWRKKML